MDGQSSFSLTACSSWSPQLCKQEALVQVVAAAKGLLGMLRSKADQPADSDTLDTLVWLLLAEDVLDLSGRHAVAVLLKRQARRKVRPVKTARRSRSAMPRTCVIVSVGSTVGMTAVRWSVFVSPLLSHIGSPLFFSVDARSFQSQRKISTKFSTCSVVAKML